MQQLDFFDVPSPCIGVCQMNANGYCRGCMRNRDERFNWMSFSVSQKKNVIRLCKQRYYRLQLAERKKQAQQQDDDPKPAGQLNLFD